MCNLVFLFCSLGCSSVYSVFYCNMFGEAISACLPTALNAAPGWSRVPYAWEFWAVILLKVFSVPLPYLSVSFGTEISFTSEIMHVLSVLSYCFFFSCLFQLSSLQVLMLCLSLSWSNLCAKVFSLPEFQFGFSVFLFIEFIIHFYMLFAVFHWALCFYSLLSH